MSFGGPAKSDGMKGMNDERVSGKSVLAVQYDDNDDDLSQI